MLYKTHELFGALLSSHVESTDELKADAKNYLSDNYNITAFDSIIIAENNADTVHLVLPYQSGVDGMTGGPVPDEDLELISGGTRRGQGWSNSPSEFADWAFFFMR